jgi:hypothetical protein
MEEPLFDQLVARVEQAASQPLERIEAAAAVRATVDADADRVMDRFVTRARDEGVSWTAIGERLGVSKQAARQRYSSRVETLAPQLEPRLRACLAQAQREAEADGSHQVHSQHLLAGLLAEGAAAAILEKVGLTTALIRAAGEHLFGPPGAPPSAAPGWSAGATAALEAATHLARANRGNLRQPCVGTEHLLAALTLDGGSRARRVLNELNRQLNKDAAAEIKRELACYLDPNPPRRRRRGKFRNAGACSFCGRTAEVGQLVAGPDVWICAACVHLATEILDERTDRD